MGGEDKDGTGRRKVCVSSELVVFYIPRLKSLLPHHQHYLLLLPPERRQLKQALIASS